MILDKIRKLFARPKKTPMAKTESPLEERVLRCGTGMTSSSFQTVRQSDAHRESWNGEPPHPGPKASWRDAFDLHCHRFPPPFERKSAPPATASRSPVSQVVVSTQNFVLTAELSRLQDENDKLADHLEKTDQELSLTRQTLHEEEQASRVVQQVLYTRQDEVVQLRRENQRLRLMTEGLTSNKKHSTKTLRAKLADAEVRATHDKAEIARLRMELQNSLQQKKVLEQDAWELWDAIISTGAQAGAQDRRGRALSRMSLRFE